MCVLCGVGVVVVMLVWWWRIIDGAMVVVWQKPALEELGWNPST